MVRHPWLTAITYLKFSLPKGYDAISESGIAMDASLRVAETAGFRNSYGLPFNPFNFQKNEPYPFVEVPLHIMDRTYYQYQKMNVADAWNDMLTFFEKKMRVVFFQCFGIIIFSLIINSKDILIYTRKSCIIFANKIFRPFHKRK